MELDVQMRLSYPARIRAAELLNRQSRETPPKLQLRLEQRNSSPPKAT